MPYYITKMTAGIGIPRATHSTGNSMKGLTTIERQQRTLGSLTKG